jgi:hypothetical protein
MMMIILVGSVGSVGGHTKNKRERERERESYCYYYTPLLVLFVAPSSYISLSLTHFSLSLSSFLSLTA